MAPAPIIEGTCMCLSIFLLVNKSHYWLVRKGKIQRMLLKNPLLYKRNDCIKKTLVLYMRKKNNLVMNTIFVLVLLYMFVYIYKCRGIYLLVICIYVVDICMFIFFNR